MTRDELLDYGFRWVEETQVSCPDGTALTIHPTHYLRSRESSGHDRRFLKALRLYSVTGADGQTETMVDELEIEKRIGDEPSFPLAFTSPTIHWVNDSPSSFTLDN